MNRLVVLVFFSASSLCAAQTGGAGGLYPQSGGNGGYYPKASVDSNMIFHSPRPLIEPASAHEIRNGWGLDILFSNNGFGLGAFYSHYFSRLVTGTANVDFTGVKNANEYSYYVWDPTYGYILYTPAKANDIYMIPVSFGVQYRLFADLIADSFRPYVNAGAGPAFLIAAPDSLEFFSGIAHARVTVVPDLFVGLGANFGGDMHAISGVNFRYYYIRYARGIESLFGEPITDFGGFYITINWGIAF